MTDNFFKNNILELKLEGFEGPIDLLLSLVKDQKVDILKIKILPLAEQYLEFLKKIIKNDIEIAAEYLVVGSILAFIKSRELLPKDENENDEIDDLYKLKNLSVKDGNTDVKILIDKNSKIYKFELKDKRKINNQLLNTLNLSENVVIE